MSTDGPSLSLVRDPDSAAAEAYRFLRTALQSAGEGRPRTLVVASAERDKGLNTAAIVANLAVAFARGGVATLLVDAEVRSPALHEVFGLDNSRGLTDCLSQPTDAPFGQPTSVEGLRVLPAGPWSGAAADLFASPRAARAIESLAESVDLALFAAAPVLTTADTVALARLVDACLLVVRAGSTQRADAQKAKAVLEASGARILGVALVRD